jgi:hypothetical protein
MPVSSLADVRRVRAKLGAVGVYLGLPNHTNNLRLLGYTDDDLAGAIRQLETLAPVLLP